MQSLPIDPFLEQIHKLVISSKPVILTASPGSGKTTRLPAFLLKKLPTQISKKIIVIVPKRVSAVSASDRIASENNWTLGEEVGYQVRFDQKLNLNTQLIFMTEGLFLKRLQSEDFWSQIQTLIIDEFHERSSNIDLILGLAFEQKILSAAFELVIMSATLNAGELKKYLGESHTMDIQAPPHKLELFYSEKNQKLVCDDLFYSSLKETLLKAWKISKKDILVFLPGQREILKFKNLIQPLFTQNKIEILHGSITLNEQKRIVKNADHLGRRIILSTNVAESSLTLSGLDCVIDSGLEKKAYREAKVGFTGLDLQRITLFSAQQRAGRAAREQAGFCFRLWHATDERSMKEQIEPEILKSSLIEESLVLYEQQVTDLAQFSWLTPPPSLTLKKANQTLQHWKLVDEKSKLTALAKTIAKWPISTENSILHYQLSLLGFEKLSAKLIAVLESGQVEAVLEKNKNALGSDISKIIENDFLDPLTDKIEKQILTLRLAKHAPALLDDFEEAIIKIYAQFFPEKIGFVKNQNNAVSMFGRGLQIQGLSLATKADFIVALAGRENHTQFTQVTCALGFDKKMAQDIFSEYAKKHTEIFFDTDKNGFYKNEQLKFETFVLNDYGKSKLSPDELHKNWKSFFKNEPHTFLKLHSDYDKIKEKLNFIEKKNLTYFNLSTDGLTQISNFENILADYILSFYETFNDYKNCDLIYLCYQALNVDLVAVLQNLPNTINSPRAGRVCVIDYSDEKAPLISLKIQDAFGWSDTPRIFNDRIPLTLELLAPNMRPAQITSQLQLFWKNSYSDVRKELRARYPKHDWPEDPSS